MIDKIKSENETERQIMEDPEWQTGAAWGMPREGHPEGQVIYHIEEVLNNIDKLGVLSEERTKLRFIGLIHDTFKHRVDITQPRVGSNNHAVIARKFAEKFTNDAAILDIIELHDEAFNAWRKGHETGKWDKAGERLRQLLDRVGSNIRLYYLFYTCDNETGDKDQECLRRFEKELGERGILHFD